MVSPLIIKVLGFLFPELALSGKNQMWDALVATDPCLLAELREAGLTPLIYTQLLRQKRHLRLPPNFLRKFQLDYASALKIAALQEQEARQVLGALSGAGVEFILLKGADLRQRLYGDIAVRPACDLDFIISPDQLVITRASLAQLGYRVFPRYLDPHPGFRLQFGHAAEYEPTEHFSLMVDLHWRILAGGGYYRLDYFSFKQKAIPGDFQGIAVWLLSPEHLLMQLCLTAFNDNFETIFKVIDIALALDRLKLDWRFFLQEVSSLRCEAPVYLVLQEMARFLPRAVPQRVLVKLAGYSPPWHEKLALSSKMRYLTLNFPMLYRHSHLREWSNYYWGKLWPEPAYLTAIYGKPDRIAYLREFLLRFSASNKI